MQSTKSAVHELIRRHITEARQMEDIGPQLNLRNDLRAHDYDLLELVMDCEDRFDITITDEEAERLTTVVDVEKLVLAKVGAEELQP